jgi:hypothetical protein
MRTHQKWSETRSISSLIYNNLNLNLKKRSEVAEEVLLCG